MTPETLARVEAGLIAGRKMIEIANEEGVPYPTVADRRQRLVKRGLLCSLRGKNAPRARGGDTGPPLRRKPSGPLPLPVAEGGWIKPPTRAQLMGGR